MRASLLLPTLLRLGRILVALLLVVGGLAGAPRPLQAEELPGSGSPVDEMTQVVEGADAYWAAFQAAEHAKLDAWAMRRDLDVTRLLGVLLREYAKLALTNDASAPRRLEAAADLVVRAGTNPAATGARQILATWQAYDRAALEREGRLRAAADAIEALDEKGDLEAVMARLAAIRPDLEAARGSLLACFLEQDRGLVAWRLGRIDDALAATRASRERAARLPWPGGELRALRYEYSLLRESGDFDGLLRAGRSAVATALRSGWRDRALAAGLQTAGHMRLAARYEDSLAIAREIRELAEAGGDRRGVADARLAEAKTLAVTGEAARAREIAEALATDPDGDVAMKVEALSVLGFVASKADRLGDALAIADRALALLQGHDAPLLVANIQTNKGIYHRRLGQLEEALACQEAAVVAARTSGNEPLHATALGNLGLVQRSLGRPEYRATLEKALAAKRKAGDQVGMLETALNLANDLVDQPESRAQGFALLNQVRTSLEKARALPPLGATHHALAHAHLRAGDLAAAHGHAEEAVGILRSIDERGLELARALETLAHVLLAQEKPVEGLTAARQALAARRGLAAGLGEEDASLLVESARRSSDLALGAALRVLDARGQADAEALAGAFDAIESGRATLLAAGVVHAEALLAAEVPPALVRAEAQARARVSGTRTRLVTLASRPAGDPRALPQARAELEAAWKTYAESVARIQREARRAAGVVFPTPTSLADVQSRLDPTGAYVAYQLGSKGAAALVVRKGSAHLVALPGTEGLAEHVEGYVGLVSAPGSKEVEPAAALYDALLRPLEPHLGGATRLVVSPDGALTFLPFDALVRREGEKAQRAVERWEIAYVPSATVWASLAEERAKGPAKGVVALGDPAYAAAAPGAPGHLKPLPRSADEARAVVALYPAAERTLLLGKDARLELLLAALPKGVGRLSALHLACHAFVDAQRPRLSALALAGGDVLDLDAIYRLRVPAELCVLSACATARGRYLQGEGVLGFVRGFFVAGVPRVVVSDWVVEDASARTLLEAFHGARMKERLGAAAALRAAKLKALAKGGEAAHPSSWAAFVLWGLPE